MKIKLKYWAVAFFITTTLFPGNNAKCGTPGDIQKAIGLYRQADFKLSKALFEELAGKDIENGERQIVRIYLGLIEIAYGNGKKADLYLSELLLSNENLELGDIAKIFPGMEKDFTSDLKKRFEEIRTKMQGKCNIRYAQKVLRANFLYTGQVDGKDSRPIRSAIKNFQIMNGLEPTGILDDKTCSNLITMEPQ